MVCSLIVDRFRSLSPDTRPGASISIGAPTMMFGDMGGRTIAIGFCFFLQARRLDSADENNEGMNPSTDRRSVLRSHREIDGARMVSSFRL